MRADFQNYFTPVFAMKFETKPMPRFQQHTSMCHCTTLWNTRDQK